MTTVPPSETVAAVLTVVHKDQTYVFMLDQVEVELYNYFGTQTLTVQGTVLQEHRHERVVIIEQLPDDFAATIVVPLLGDEVVEVVSPDD